MENNPLLQNRVVSLFPHFVAQYKEPTPVFLLEVGSFPRTHVAHHPFLVAKTPPILQASHGIASVASFGHKNPSSIHKRAKRHVIAYSGYR